MTQIATTEKKTLEHYLLLKYPIELVEDDGGWAVSVPDLPGCNSFGETTDEAIRNIEEAKQLWMKSQIQTGGEIPEPTDDDEYSGKFILRIPRSLHRSLARQALKQGVSLNHYASYLLSERNPLYLLQRTLEQRAHLWRETPFMWIHQHETPKRQYLLLGARYSGDITAITLLSKPATRGTMRVPQTLEEQYEPDYAHNRR